MNRSDPLVRWPVPTHTQRTGNARRHPFRKDRKVKATGAKVLATANPGCHRQLGAGVRMFNADCLVVHVVELLDESYRKAGFYQPPDTQNQN